MKLSVVCDETDYFIDAVHHPDVISISNATTN